MKEGSGWQHRSRFLLGMREFDMGLRTINFLFGRCLLKWREHFFYLHTISRHEMESFDEQRIASIA